MNKYTGTCLCNACCYTVTGQAPQAMYLCHCSRCRKETGSIHGSNVFFTKAQLEWQKGEDNISNFHLQNTKKQRAFCKTCGSPLPWQYAHGHVVVPAGSLNDDSFLTPTAHIFCASRASWEDKLATVKRFDELPD